jgi:PHD/YefM family antitoxin component YafN of YafNO toxin-antitoxin module
LDLFLFSSLQSSCAAIARINIAEDIHSFTTFKRNSSDLMKRMKETGRPLVLTINGKAEAVLLDPTVYQVVADQVDAVMRIRRGPRANRERRRAAGG